MKQAKLTLETFNFLEFQIYAVPNVNILGCTKGQLISKAIYGLITSPKKRTDKFDLFAF